MNFRVCGLERKIRPKIYIYERTMNVERENPQKRSTKPKKEYTKVKWPHIKYWFDQSKNYSKLPCYFVRRCESKYKNLPLIMWEERKILFYKTLLFLRLPYIFFYIFKKRIISSYQKRTMMCVELVTNKCMICCIRTYYTTKLQFIFHIFFSPVHAVQEQKHNYIPNDELQISIKINNFHE